MASLATKDIEGGVAGDIESVRKVILGTREARINARAGREILNAAAHCFKENGFAATSIDDVARALGATKGMVYHHFRSKTDLFFAVYRRGMELNQEAIAPYLDISFAPLERLTYMGMAHALVLMAQQPYQRVLAQGVVMHQTGSTTAAQRETLLQLIATRDHYEALFRNAIKAAADEQGLATNDLSVATKSFLAVLNGTVFWYKPRQESGSDEQIIIARELLGFALRGLGTTFDPDFEFNTLKPADAPNNSMNEETSDE